MAFLIALKYKPNIRQKEFNLQTKVEDPYNDNKIHVSLLLLIATSDTTYLSFSDYATIRPASARPIGLVLRSAPCRPRFEPSRGWISGRRWRSLLCALKKISSLVPCPKHSWGPAFLTGNGPLCMGVTGVRGFSRLAWEGLLLSVMPWGRSPPAGLVFFFRLCHKYKQRAYLFNGIFILYRLAYFLNIKITWAACIFQDLETGTIQTNESWFICGTSR